MPKTNNLLAVLVFEPVVTALNIRVVNSFKEGLVIRNLRDLLSLMLGDALRDTDVEQWGFSRSRDHINVLLYDDDILVESWYLRYKGSDDAPILWALLTDGTLKEYSEIAK